MRLNHKTLIDDRQVTPFLVQGANVYCFDEKKQTVILDVEKFKKSKKNIVRSIMPRAVIRRKKASFNYAGSGIISLIGSADYKTIKKKSTKKKIDLSYTAEGSIKVFGASNTSMENKTFVVPPIIDNTRYLRPTLDDEYI